MDAKDFEELMIVLKDISISLEMVAYALGEFTEERKKENGKDN